MTMHFINNSDDKLLTRRQAAEFLGTHESTLAVWACTKRYPLPMLKIGKFVRYRLSDLKTFIDKHIIN